MSSCIYSGYVTHRRFKPRPHSFCYHLFMMYLDLAELDTLFDKHWLWSSQTNWRPAQFRRSDHFGDPNQPLDLCVRDLVEQETGRRPQGPIRLLTHLRYFGYCFNPISIFYCFDENGERPEVLVAEVTNTPWKERICYVLSADNETNNAHCNSYLQQLFHKEMHVSPFMPMNLDYYWRSNTPNERLTLYMNVLEKHDKLFDATLSLHRQSITNISLTKILLNFPLMTLKVTATIHWEGFRLWLKKTPFFPHPSG